MAGAPKKNTNAKKDDAKTAILFGQRWTEDEATIFRRYMKTHRLTQKQMIEHATDALLYGQCVACQCGGHADTV